MSTVVKHTGKAASFPKGMGISAIVSTVITILTAAIVAGFLNSETITWEQAGYWIMGILFVSAFLGSKCAISVIKRQRLAVSFMSGLLYWGILLCITTLFFGGNFEAIWETGGIIASGCGVAGLLTFPQNKKYRKKSKSTYR